MDDFSGSEILEKRVFPLIARTKVVRDDTFQNAHFGNEITLKLKDGKTYTYRGTHAKGEACNPMTEEELRDKFLCCGERYYTKIPCKPCSIASVPVCVFPLFSV